MAISINGTSGISGVDGSAGTPALQGTDTNTGIAFGSDVIIASTGGTERLRIDSSGRVGIGVPSAAVTLDCNGNIRVPQNTFYQASDGAGGWVELIKADSSNNTAIKNNKNLAITFETGGSERARIDSSGRLLVGTSTALSTNTGALLQLYGTGGSEFIGSSANNNPAAGDPITMIRGMSQSGSSFGTCATIAIQADAASSINDYPGRIVFSTTADGASSPTERLRILSDGQLRTLAAQSAFFVSSAFSAGTSEYLIGGQYGASSPGGGTTSFIVYTNGNVRNTNNSYGAISDVKLKENIVDAGSQWDDLKALQVRKYNFKEGQTHTQIGLVAQEVELISPGLVTESPDRDEDGNDLGTVTKSVNYSVLYMKAVKALQEAMERIESLETRLAALEVTP